MIKLKFICLQVLVLCFQADFFAQDFLNFDIKDSSYLYFKKADFAYNEGNDSLACSYYAKSIEFIQYFPYELYQYSRTEFSLKDTIGAQKMMYLAMQNNLRFSDLKFFESAPLVKELSLSPKIYDNLRQTCFADSLCYFPELREELMKIKVKDQFIRQNNVTNDEFAAQDKSNQIEFDKILNKYGWPGIKEVGVYGESAAFLIAQHADNDLVFQKRCLDLMTVEFKKGNVTISSYAMLVDRYLVNTGRKQLFATQCELDTRTEQMISKPILFPEEVDIFCEDCSNLDRLAIIYIR